MEITLYTIHCAKCNVLQKKMDAKNIPYTVVDNMDAITAKGFSSAPILVVDGTVYEFSQANAWVNQYAG